MVKNPPANVGKAGGAGSIPGLGRCLGEGNGNPLQYSFLGNPLDSGAWWATVHGMDTTELHTYQNTWACDGAVTEGIFGLRGCAHHFKLSNNFLTKSLHFPFPQGLTI